MKKLFTIQLSSLGFLRLGLIFLAFLNTLLSLFYLLAHSLSDWPAADTLWSPVLTMVVPVLSILFLVVIFFDYVMSRVRASDKQDERQLHFKAISRIELLIIAILLAWWVPYFMTLIS